MVGNLEVYKIVNGLISLEVWKFGSLEVFKSANRLISFEVREFTS